MASRVRVFVMLIAVFGCFASSCAYAQSGNGMQDYAEGIKKMVMPNLYQPLSITTADGKRHDFKVEIADTPSKSMHGLMHRKSMPAENGMLFLFGDGEKDRGFWMRNTLIPLDMIFIRSDGTIRSIHENAKPKDETVIHSDGAVCCVLEVNGGVTKMLGIQAGDVVHYKNFRNALAK